MYSQISDMGGRNNNDSGILRNFGLDYYFKKYIIIHFSFCLCRDKVIKNYEEHFC